MGNLKNISDNMSFLSTIDWVMVIVGMIIIITVASFFKDWVAKLPEKFGFVTKRSLKEKAQAEAIDNLRKEVIQFKENRVHDREQSFDIQHQLTARQDDTANALIDVNNKLDNLTQVIKDMQDKNDLQEKARLKDRISQVYRYYHKEQKWTSMEKESFSDLIRSYEASGGKNSFVHSICEPESETGEVIDE